MGSYKHTMEVIGLKPRQIAAHLREHGVEPKGARKGYERSVWSSQHECLHRDNLWGEQQAHVEQQVRIDEHDCLHRDAPESWGVEDHEAITDAAQDAETRLNLEAHMRATKIEFLTGEDARWDLTNEELEKGRGEST